MHLSGQYYFRLPVLPQSRRISPDRKGKNKPAIRVNTQDRQAG